MDLQGIICWEDDNNAASLQPSCVTVLLLPNGRPMASTLVSAEDFWVFSFSDLPVYENGREIFYSLQQEPVAHYQTACHGFVITNRLRSPEKDGTDVQIVSVFSD